MIRFSNTVHIIILWSLALMSAILPSRSQAETPLDLSGTWKIKFESEEQNGHQLGWHNPNYDDAAWEEIAVPGQWDPNLDGVAWYRTKVTVPAELARDPDAKIIFHQVDDTAKVYLNGKLATENYSWNTPFFTSLPDGLTESPELTIAVRVEDFGGPGGILKDVVVRHAIDPEEIFTTPIHDKEPRSTLQDWGHLVMYSVYVRNFSEEGTFDALTARLPELKDFGVNILWLLPIHPIGMEERKGPDGSPYAIQDYFAVNPDLGTEEDFQELVDAAHQHGMKVIIDSVMNHTSHDSVWATQHPEWFMRDEEGNPKPEHPDWADVVDLDWENPVVWEQGTKVLEYWVREFNIDGYRCDVADLMPHDWWAQAVEATEQVKPVIMLAESQKPDHHLYGFDLTYNEGVRDTTMAILEGKRPAYALKNEVFSRIYGYPEGAAQILFTENHDKDRAVNEYGGAAGAKLGAVLTTTLPGIPLLYTGTEVGADADRNETFFTKTAVDFSTDPHGMRAHWKALLDFRKQHESLQIGDITFPDYDQEENIFAYERAHGEDRVLVVLNLTGSAVTATIESDLLAEQTIELPAHGWQIVAANGDAMSSE